MPRLLRHAVAPVLLVGLAWPALRENSATFDETFLVPAGYTYVTGGDMRLSPDHPWLLKALAALPLVPLAPAISAAAERALAAGDREIEAMWVFGYRFLYEDNHPQELLVRARMVTLALGVALVALVLGWSTELYGADGGLFAAILFALDPTVLAHATVATTDLGAGLFFAATLFFARRALHGARGRDGIAAALAAAGAVSAKFSTLMLVPVLAVLGALHVARRPRAGDRIRGRAGRAAVALALFLGCGGVAVASLWAVYGGRGPSYTATLPQQIRHIRAMRLYGESLARGEPVQDDAAFAERVDRAPPLAAERLIAFCAAYRLLPPTYLFGLAYQTGTLQVRNAFLRGRIVPTGSPAYFPSAFLWKTPTATLVVLAAALVGLVATRSSLPTGELPWLVVPLLAVAISAVTARVDIGIRHLLLLYPFLYVLAGSVPGLLARRWSPGAARVVAVLAVLLTAVETVSARPYFLSFFNRPAGGSGGGIELLSDSNLDWGQGLPALRRWMDEHGVARVNLAYFGSADPHAYGIDFVPLAGSFRAHAAAETVGYAAVPAELPGWVAIGATHLQGVYLDDATRRRYAALRARAPAAVLAGGALYVYRVDRWDE